MALSYEEGISTLRDMFPGWEEQLLSDMLEMNHGHLENTIDMMISMDANDARSVVQATKGTPQSTPSARSRDTKKSASFRIRENKLPDDFLKLPDSSEQEQRDAALAEMMQNELFRQQLMEDDDMAAHFGGTAQTNAASQEKTAAEMASDTFSYLSERVSSMSDTMRRRMQDMYAHYRTTGEISTRQDLYSHRPLMAEDSSDEEDANAGHVGEVHSFKYGNRTGSMSEAASSDFSSAGASQSAAGMRRRPSTKKQD